MDLSTWFRKHTEMQQQQEQQLQQTSHTSPYQQQQQQNVQQFMMNQTPSSHMQQQSFQDQSQAPPTSVPQLESLQLQAQTELQQKQLLDNTLSTQPQQPQVQPVLAPQQQTGFGVAPSLSDTPPAQPLPMPHTSRQSATPTQAISSTQMLQLLQTNMSVLQRQWAITNAQPDGPNKVAALQYLTLQMRRLMNTQESILQTARDPSKQTEVTMDGNTAHMRLTTSSPLVSAPAASSQIPMSTLMPMHVTQQSQTSSPVMPPSQSTSHAASFRSSMTPGPNPTFQPSVNTMHTPDPKPDPNHSVSLSFQNHNAGEPTPQLMPPQSDSQSITSLPQSQQPSSLTQVQAQAPPQPQTKSTPMSAQQTTIPVNPVPRDFVSTVYLFLAQRGVALPPDWSSPFVGPAANGRPGEMRSIDMQSLFAKVISYGGSEQIFSMPNGWAFLAQQLNLAVEPSNNTGSLNAIPTPSEVPGRLAAYYTQRLSLFERSWIASQRRNVSDSSCSGTVMPDRPGSDRHGNLAPRATSNRESAPPDSRSLNGAGSPSSAQIGMSATTVGGSPSMPIQNHPFGHLEPNQVHMAIGQHLNQLQALVSAGQLTPQMAMARYSAIQQALQAYNNERVVNSNSMNPAYNLQSPSSVTLPATPGTTLSQSSPKVSYQPQQHYQQQNPVQLSLQEQPPKQPTQQPYQPQLQPPQQPDLKVQPRSQQIPPQSQPQGQPSSLQQYQTHWSQPQDLPSNMPNTQIPSVLQTVVPPVSSVPPSERILNAHLSNGPTSLDKSGSNTGSQVPQQHAKSDTSSHSGAARSTQTHKPAASKSSLPLLSTPPKHPALGRAQSEAPTESPDVIHSSPTHKVSAYVTDMHSRSQGRTSMDNIVPNKYRIEYLPSEVKLHTYGGRDLDKMDHELAPRLAEHARALSVKELGMVDIFGLTMSLQSGMSFEVAYALNTLLILSAGVDAPANYQFPLAPCEDLLDVLLDLLEQVMPPDSIESLVEYMDERDMLTYCDAVDMALQDEGEVRKWRRQSVSLSEEHAADQRVAVAQAIVTIFRNLAIMPDNMLFLSTHQRFIPMIASISRSILHDKRWGRYANATNSMFSLRELLDIEKDLLTILLGVSGESFDLTRFSVDSTVALVDMLRFFILDALEFESRQGASPMALERIGSLSSNSASSAWSTTSSSIVSPGASDLAQSLLLFYQAPHHAFLALQALSRLSLPDHNRELLARQVPAYIQVQLIHKLVAFLPVSSADFRRLASITRLEYTETVAFCLYNVVYLAPPSVKVTIRDRLGITGTLFRAAKHLLLSGKDYTQNPYNVLSRRLIETMRLLSDGKDYFGVPPLLGMNWPLEEASTAPATGQDAVSLSPSPSSRSPPPFCSRAGVLCGQDDKIIEVLVRTANLDASLTSELLALV